MKPTFLLLLLSFSVFAQAVSSKVEFLGQTSTHQYFPVSCFKDISSPGFVYFTSREAAEKAGYTFSSACSKLPTAATHQSGPITLNVQTERYESNKLPTLIEINTDLKRYAGRFVWVRAQIELSTNYFGDFKYREDDYYAFTLRDDTSGIYAYMQKIASGDRLRNMLLREGRSNDIIGTCKLLMPDGTTLRPGVASADQIELLSCGEFKLFPK
jgi:hypothetical protein